MYKFVALIHLLQLLYSLDKVRIVVADDHHILLDGLNALLQKQKDIQVVGLFNNGKDVYDAIPKLDVDVALIDINMPEMDGHELTENQKRISSYSRHHPLYA